MHSLGYICCKYIYSQTKLEAIFTILSKLKIYYRLDINQQSRLNGLTKFAVELKNFDKSWYEVESRNSQIKKDPLKIYTCKVNNWGKEFKRIQNLVMHLRVHFNVKNYFCQFWTKSFTQKGNLEKHMKQHLKPRLFERKDTNCKYYHSKFIWRVNQME